MVKTQEPAGEISEELIDTLIAISVVSKRLAAKLQRQLEEKKNESLGRST